MPPSFCLVKKTADRFKDIVKKGEIDPDVLANLSSNDREKFFVEKFGKKDASNINYLFEKNFILRNKEKAYLRWAKELLGITDTTRRDLVTNIQRWVGTEENGKFKLLNPESEREFLKELVAMRLGTKVSFEQTKEITNLANKVSEWGNKVEKLKETMGNKAYESQDAVNWGLAQFDLMDYANSLVTPTAREKFVSLVSLPRTLMSSLDVSAAFRQGWGSVGTKEFWQNFKNLFIYYTKKDNYRRDMAKILVDPYYNKLKKGGFEITGMGKKLQSAEEAFQSKIAEKIPAIGKLIRGSEQSYSGFLTKLRFDRAKNLLIAAESAGEPTTSKLLKDIVNVVGTFTGRGNLPGGFAGAAPELNQIFFAPRKIMATINMFNPVYYAKLSPVARYAALRQLGASLVASATVLELAKMGGAKVEFDPRSADFGKIKVGKTRYDVSGGNANYLVLLSRLATNKTKSTKGGKPYKLGGYGKDNRLGIAWKWLLNKAAPIPSFARSYLEGQNAVGEKFDIKQSLDLLTPMIVRDTFEMYKKDKNQVIPATILNAFGIGVQNY